MAASEICQTSTEEKEKTFKISTKNTLKWNRECFEYFKGKRENKSFQWFDSLNLTRCTGMANLHKFMKLINPIYFRSQSVTSQIGSNSMSTMRTNYYQGNSIFSFKIILMYLFAVLN